MLKKLYPILLAVLLTCTYLINSAAAQSYVAPRLVSDGKKYVSLYFDNGPGYVYNTFPIRGYNNCYTTIPTPLSGCNQMREYAKGSKCVAIVDKRDYSKTDLACVIGIKFADGANQKTVCYQRSNTGFSISEVDCPVPTAQGNILPSDTTKPVASVSIPSSSFKAIDGKKIDFQATVRVKADKNYNLLIPASATSVRITACQEDGRGFCAGAEPQKVGAYDKNNQLITKFSYDSVGRGYRLIKKGEWIDFKVSSLYEGLPNATYRGYIAGVDVVQAFGINDKTVELRALLNNWLYTSETALLGTSTTQGIDKSKAIALYGSCPDARWTYIDATQPIGPFIDDRPCGRFFGKASPRIAGIRDTSVITEKLEQDIGYGTGNSALGLTYRAVTSNGTDYGTKLSLAQLWISAGASGLMIERAGSNKLYFSVPQAGGTWKKIAIFVGANGTKPNVSQLHFDFYKDKTVVSLPSVSDFAKRVFEVDRQVPTRATSKVFGNSFAAISKGKLTIESKGGLEKIYLPNGISVISHALSVDKLQLGVAATCSENWQCGTWGSCAAGIKRRSCSDSNSCGSTILKPINILDCALPVSSSSSAANSSSKPSVVRSSSSSIACRPRWTCTAWSACKKGLNGVLGYRRTCTDANSCPVTNAVWVSKPIQYRRCSVVGKPYSN
ncbi:MAG: hypothetical protein IT292_09365 [Deltaproteobacteria bacterium]|nr:hypothetical protein [Deltaproteobacteria bacterium]